MDLRMKFNEDEKNYDKFRPLYPDELFKDIMEYVHLDEMSQVLEIGTGTGQAALPFLNTGCKLTAIELGKNLCDFVKRKFSNYENFHVVNADFMTVPINSNSFDLAYCATAFHWLPAEERCRKVMELLKPGGSVALFWNHPFPNRKDDESNLVNRRIYSQYRPSDKEPEEFTEKDCEPYRLELECSGFKNIRTKLYRRTRTLSADSYIGLLNTYSDHRALNPAVKLAFEKEMKTALDLVGGSIHIYDTIDLYLATKP